MKYLLTITSIVILAGGLWIGLNGHSAVMTISFVASMAFLFTANLDRISEFRASGSGIEAKTREIIAQAETTLTELQVLAKIMGTLTLSLVKRSGRLSGYADDEQELIRASVLNVLEKVGIPKAEIPGVLDEWHTYTEYDYAQAIFDSTHVPDNAEPQIMEEWRALRSRNILKIPTPSEIRSFLEKYGFMTEDLNGYLKDYEHYREFKVHRRPDVWKERKHWGHLRKT